MFGLAFALWIIDIHMVVSEVQITFLSNSTEPLAALYSAARSHNVRFSAVENILYAYMVCLLDLFLPSSYTYTLRLACPFRPSSGMASSSGAYTPSGHMARRSELFLCPSRCCSAR